MAPRLLPAGADPVRPTPPTPVTIHVDGEPVPGVRGQSLAGVILASGTLGLRRTSVHDTPRSVFCGIGVCYDCLVEVNGQRDVRSCQRRATDGDVVRTQYDPLPDAPLGEPGTPGVPAAAGGGRS